MIAFEIQDLPDNEPTRDLWEYSYTVSDFPREAGFVFSVLFDAEFYTSLEDPPSPPNVDWDVISLQPDTFLDDPGRYDALALVDGATLTAGFAISFVYLGTGIPQSQPFEIFDATYHLIETGNTVPEPGTATLVALGLSCMATRRRES